MSVHAMVTLRRDAIFALVLSSAVGPSCATAEKPEVIEPVIGGGRTPGTPGTKTITVHLGPSWFKWRSKQLGLSIEKASARDAESDERGPPRGFWDGEIAIEAAAIWTALCNDCHGGRRRVFAAAEIPPPAADWSTGTGFFFGRKRLRRDVFRTIQNGGPPILGKPSEMPAWKGRLSHEVSWALAYFIEYESRGIEGAFPPGLYPERGPETEVEAGAGALPED